MAYTKEDLEGKDLSELRAAARALGINPAGRTSGHLIMAIVKESKAQEGTATSASPVVAPRRRAAPAPPPLPEEADEDEDDIPAAEVAAEPDEDEEQEEIKVEPIGKKSTQEARELLRGIAQAIMTLLGEEAVEAEPAKAPAQKPAPAPKVEKPEPPPEAGEKRGRGRPKKEAAPPPPPPPPPEPEPEPEEEEEDPEDDAEMSDELDINKEDVLKADFATLTTWAKVINKNGLGPIACEGVKEPALRKAVLDIVEAAGEEEDEEPAAKPKWPEWVDVGVRVEANIEGEGFVKGVIKEVADEYVKVELFDGDICDIDDPADLRPAPSKTPRERKKA